MRKLEEFARKAMVPLGYLFLSSPPQESIGIPDFRTCNEPLDFVGKLKSSTSVVRAADQIRSRLGLQSNWQLAHSTWEAALTTLRRAMESIGIFVCVTNQVGLNTRRSLNHEEFRGFVEDDNERYCNQVAAEFLIPKEKFSAFWEPNRFRARAMRCHCQSVQG